LFFFFGIFNATKEKFEIVSGSLQGAFSLYIDQYNIFRLF
jgi:hypothetical protein